MASPYKYSEHAGQAVIQGRRGVVYLPASMLAIHEACRPGGLRIDITLSRALTAHGGAELVAVVADDAEADAWRAELVAVGLPGVAGRRDAVCPGCGGKNSAPWPLPAGWLCPNAHPAGA